MRRSCGGDLTLCYSTFGNFCFQCIKCGKPQSLGKMLNLSDYIPEKKVDNKDWGDGE